MCDSCRTAGASAWEVATRAAAEPRDDDWDVPSPVPPLQAYTCLAAIDAGHVACIHAAASAMTTEEKGRTPWNMHICRAVQRDSLDALLALFTYDVVQHDYEWHEILSLATRRDSVDIAAHLLDMGVPMNYNIFFSAVGALKCLQLFDARGLLHSSVMPAEYSEDAEMFATIIGIAASHGNIAIVQWAHAQHGAALTEADLMDAVRHRGGRFNDPHYLTPPNWDAVIAFYAEHGIVAAA